MSIYHRAIFHFLFSLSFSIWSRGLSQILIELEHVPVLQCLTGPLMWYKDRRFAPHKYFKFIVHNIITRKRTSEHSTYIMKEQIGDEHMSLHDLTQTIQRGDNCIAQKIL